MSLSGVAARRREVGCGRGRGQRSERQTNTEMWSRTSSGKVGEVSPIDFAVTLFPGDVGSVYPRTNSAVSAFSLFNSQGVIDDDEWPVLSNNCDNTESYCMSTANDVSSPRIAVGESKPSVTRGMSQPLTTSVSSTSQSLATDMQRLFYTTWPPSFSSYIKKEVTERPNAGNEISASGAVIMPRNTVTTGTIDRS